METIIFLEDGKLYLDDRSTFFVLASRFKSGDTLTARFGTMQGSTCNWDGKRGRSKFGKAQSQRTLAFFFFGINYGHNEDIF